MIWPKALAQIAVNKALHGQEGREDHIAGWKISRYRFFMYCFGGMFLYYVSTMPAGNDTWSAKLRKREKEFADHVNFTVVPWLYFPGAFLFQLDDLDFPDQRHARCYHWKYLWFGS